MLTVVIALRLVGHLSVSAGQTHRQQATSWPEVTDDVTPSQIAIEAHVLFADLDKKRSASQLATLEGNSTTSLSWDVSTTASVDIMTATPRHLISKGNDQGDINTPIEKILTTSPGDSFTTSQESILSTAQGKAATTREGVADLIMTPVLENGKVQTRMHQLVVCACPLPTPDDCRRFLSGLHIDGIDDLSSNEIKVRKRYNFSSSLYITLICSQSGF